MTTSKTLLIVGVTSELGRHCAKAWLDRGWQVIGASRRGPEDDGVPTGIRHISADLSEPGQVEALTCEIDSCPDLIINCAATYQKDGEESFSLDELSKIFMINALAPYHISLELLTRKPEDQFACFVFIGATAMFNADKSSAVYGASKAALRVLATSVADRCRGRKAAATNLVLGHLENEWKLAEINELAQRHGIETDEVTKRFLRKAEPNFMIDHFIEFDACVQAIRYLSEVGPTGNGLVLRLDGGASGSLV